MLTQQLNKIYTEFYT